MRIKDAPSTSAPTADAGYFPTHTLTEDYALGMEMRRKGWRGMFVEEELVRGTAPDKVRAAFGQRSRWCKVCVHLCRPAHSSPALFCSGSVSGTF